MVNMVLLLVTLWLVMGIVKGYMIVVCCGWLPLVAGLVHVLRQECFSRRHFGAFMLLHNCQVLDGFVVDIIWYKQTLINPYRKETKSYLQENPKT